MCSGKSGGTPEVKKAPTAPPMVAPIEADTSVRTAGDQERKRRQAASGRSDTVLTGGTLGLAPIGGKQLLGQ